MLKSAAMALRTSEDSILGMPSLLLDLWFSSKSYREVDTVPLASLSAT